MFRSSIEVLQVEQARIADEIYNIEVRLERIHADGGGYDERARLQKKIELANEYYDKHEAAINLLKTALVEGE